MPLLHLRRKPQTNEAGLHFRWLFVAFFEDGSVIKQDQTDKAKEQPEGSAFADVMARMSTTKLTSFELRHEDGDKVVTVDLITGNFIVNGIPVSAHNQNFKPENYPLEIVYFHETLRHQDVLFTVEEDMSVSKKNVGDTRGEVGLTFIGWTTEVNGKPKQVTLAVG